MMTLIKLGGSILEDAENTRQIAEDCKNLIEAGHQLILVHGGGKAINHWLATLKISSTYIDGLRVTTPEMMDVIEMVMAGEVNKKLVRILNGVGVPALGLSGVDGQLFQCAVLDSRLGRVG